MPTTKRRRSKRSSSRITEKDIHSEVRSWTRETLETFALDLISNDPEARADIERRIASRRDVKVTIAIYRCQIDEVLDIDFVDWREAFDYSLKLGRVLDDVVKLGKTHPAEALDLTLHFAKGAAALGAAVHDECEVSSFCDDVGEAIVKLARTAKANTVEVATTLVDISLSDECDRTYGYPDLAVKLCRKRADRVELAASLEERAAKTGPHTTKRLQGLAKSLRSLKKAKAKRKR